MNEQLTKYSSDLNVREEYKNNTLEQNQEIAKASTKGFAVATFNLKGDLNLGTIMRTAHLTGADDFFIWGHRGWDRRSSVGVHNYIAVERDDQVTNFTKARDFLFDRGYYPVVVEHGGMDLDLWMHLYNNTLQYLVRVNKSTVMQEWKAIDDGLEYHSIKPCFIFGPEEGFSSDWPPNIQLRQTGVSRSYNVSTAAAIVLYNFSFGK